MNRKISRLIDHWKLWSSCTRVYFWKCSCTVSSFESHLISRGLADNFDLQSSNAKMLKIQFAVIVKFLISKCLNFLVVASNASIAFALYNCCLPDPQRCDHCAKNIIERYAQRTDMINNMELRESSVDRHLGRTATGSTDFPRANYTQSLPRYVVLSSKPTSV